MPKAAAKKAIPKAPAKKKEEDAKEGEEEEENDAPDAEGEANVAPNIADMQLAKNFLDYFQRLPAKGNDVIRFFDRKGFYTVHGDEAIKIARDYNKTVATLKYLGPDRLASQSVSMAQFDTIIRDLLLVRSCKVEVHSNASGAWLMTHKASPGNLEAFEDRLFRANANALPEGAGVIAAARVRNEKGLKIMGVAYVDVSTCTLAAGEFVENDLLSNFESFIVQNGVRECLFTEGKDEDSPKLIRILQGCDVAFTNAQRAKFKADNIEQDLTRLLDPDALKALVPLLELKDASAAVAALLDYLELLKDDSNLGKWKLISVDLGQYMKLDSAAVRALNLAPQATDLNKTMNLYSVLNKCRTPMGSRRLMQWIKQPLKDLAAIVRRQDIVEALRSQHEVRLELQDQHLKRMPDVMRISRRFQKGKAGLQDCVRIYQMAIALPHLRNRLVNTSGVTNGDPDHAELLHQFAERLDRVIGVKKAEGDMQEDGDAEPKHTIEEGLHPYIDLIETTIDLELADREHEYKLKAEFDVGLQKLQEEINELKNQLSTVHKKAIREISLEEKRLHLENNKQFGWHFRVSSKDAKLITPFLGKGYNEVDKQRKAGLKFDNAKLRELGSKLVALNAEYEQQQSALVKELLATAASYTSLLEEANEVMAELDVLASLAEVASSDASYVRPRLSAAGKGDIRLKAARHPCLALSPDIVFVANDVNLLRDSARFQIITGPNMGGKSTYIRMVGVLVLMAQIGSFVPCESAEMTIIDCILARVGAGDNQLRGVSTFMAEMLETASILKAATDRSLIIIDELGRGTSTYDGFGLAWAISEYICQKIHAFCFFATHFHELTALAERKELRVANYSVQAHVQDGKMLLTYRVLPKPCDQSFGIHVAEMAHFPPAVVEMAKRKAQELENFESQASKRQAVTAEQAQSEKSVREFVDQFSRLPLAQMSPAEALKTVAKLHADLIERPSVKK